MNVIIHTIPAKAEFSQKPPASDQINYGKYLTNAASCIECHTSAKSGQLIEGMEYAGGRYFPMEDGGTVVSNNITPDKETGIGNWTEEAFIQRFKAFDKSVNKVNDVVKPGDYNTIMPWSKYAEMKNEDLAAVYAYLRTVKPISNKIEKVYLKK
jgi:mono/diheme cytochrome c family protein